jgi:hypothetical protein
MAKPKKTVAAAPSAAILVAVHELSGGGVTLSPGAELTAALREEIGLDDEAVADLLQRGHLLKGTARVAGDEAAAGLADAIARAEAAEAEVEVLKAQLAEATKPAKQAAPAAAPAQ